MRKLDRHEAFRPKTTSPHIMSQLVPAMSTSSQHELTYYTSIIPRPHTSSQHPKPNRPRPKRQLKLITDEAIAVDD